MAVEYLDNGARPLARATPIEQRIASLRRRLAAAEAEVSITSDELNRALLEQAGSCLRGATRYEQLRARRQGREQ